MPGKRERDGKTKKASKEGASDDDERDEKKQKKRRTAEQKAKKTSKKDKAKKKDDGSKHKKDAESSPAAPSVKSPKGAGEEKGKGESKLEESKSGGSATGVLFAPTTLPPALPKESKTPPKGESKPPKEAKSEKAKKKSKKKKSAESDSDDSGDDCAGVPVKGMRAATIRARKAFLEQVFVGAKTFKALGKLFDRSKRVRAVPRLSLPLLLLVVTLAAEAIVRTWRTRWFKAIHEETVAPALRGLSERDRETKSFYPKVPAVEISDVQDWLEQFLQYIPEELTEKSWEALAAYWAAVRDEFIRYDLDCGRNPNSERRPKDRVRVLRTTLKDLGKTHTAGKIAFEVESEESGSDDED